MKQPSYKSPVDLIDNNYVCLTNSKMRDLSVTQVEVQKEVQRVMGRISKLSLKLN